MTLPSTSAALGRAEVLATTKGRRKVVAKGIEYGETTVHPNGYTPIEPRLIGPCGHVLRWLAAVPVFEGTPMVPRYLTDKVGRRVTCQHNDCRIPTKEQR